MSFLDALKQKSEATKQVVRPMIQAPIAVPVTAPIIPEPTKQEDQIVVTCERVINKNRLDVFFSRKPSAEILSALKRAGFWYRPSDKAWFHQDTEDSRRFCIEVFNAVFSDDTGTIVNEDPRSIGYEESTTEPVSTIEPEQPEHVSTEFEIYRKQVNELLAHLKIEPADLMLLAIDILHKQVFSKDS